MERRRKMPPLLHQHWVAFVPRKYVSGAADTAYDGSANEHSLNVAAAQITRWKPRDPAIELASVGIALDRDIHQPERTLRRPGNLLGHQDRPGAGAENWLCF